MQNFIGLVKQAASAGILSGGYPYAHNFWYVGANAPVFARRTNTIAEALAIMQEKDVLMLGPQTYDEGNLVIDTPNVTLIGTGNRQETSIAPSATASNGLNIKSTGVTLINVDVSQGATGIYAVKAGYETILSLNRFRAYGCKFEGNGIGLHLHGMSDVLLDDCEFAWSTSGLVLQPNSHGFCTEVFVGRSRFHNLVTAGISGTGHVVDNLEVSDCIFDSTEDGSGPTKFLDLSDNANMGLFTRNSFRVATNLASKMTIGTGLFWLANATEAGLSTARPA